MKLDVVVTDVSQVKKDLAVEVAAEEVKAEYEKAYDAYVRHAKVPGFRPGRVPRGVIKQRFSKEVKDEVIGQLLPHALEHAITDKKLRFVGEPHIEDISVNEGGPLKFKASIEVLPEIELKEYKGLKATKQVERVTGEDVERVIEKWRENAAELVPVEDRPSQDGDFVSVNLVGKYVDPQGPHEQENLIADNVEIEINGPGTQPEFSDNLRGVKADDVREFRVVYPEDFGSKGLAGKSLDFTATVT
ncbi:MAG: trigger factor, partial [Acidobacteriota bacterium]|nr:trigger factor [Acidobacteriota bacterium]